MCAKKTASWNRVSESEAVDREAPLQNPLARGLTCEWKWWANTVLGEAKMCLWVFLECRENLWLNSKVRKKCSLGLMSELLNLFHIMINDQESYIQADTYIWIPSGMQLLSYTVKRKWEIVLLRVCYLQNRFLTCYAYLCCRRYCTKVKKS